jgi:hypothetical protein
MLGGDVKKLFGGVRLITAKLMRQGVTPRISKFWNVTKIY